MGQCSSSSASTDGEIGANEVLIDVKVSGAMPGAEESTWQVRLERGATIANVKQHISELYDVPVQMQVLRRMPDGEPLGDEESLGQESRSSMHLSVKNPLQDLVSALTGSTMPIGQTAQGANPLDLISALTGGVAPGGGQAPGANPLDLVSALTGGVAPGGGQTQGATNPLDLVSALTGGTVPGGGQAQGANPLTALTEQMTAAMAEMNAIQESLAEAEYSLKFVMPAQNSQEQEKRCTMKVAATATVNNVLDMVKRELKVESKRLALEFAGQALSAAANVHISGLSDGDTVMVVPVV